MLTSSRIWERLFSVVSIFNEAPVGTYVQWYDQFSLVWEQKLSVLSSMQILGIWI